MSGRFTHRNESFTCLTCREIVQPLATGCRNHCPRCLTSRHVDIFPGDRANPCGGVMAAVAYQLTGHKGIMLCFRCLRCGEQTRNIAALGDPTPDSYETILKLDPSRKGSDARRDRGEDRSLRQVNEDRSRPSNAADDPFRLGSGSGTDLI